MPTRPILLVLALALSVSAFAFFAREGPASPPTPLAPSGPLADGVPLNPDSVATRTFDFTYTAGIDGIAEGARRVDVWMPYPESDANQQILSADVSSPYPTNLYQDPEYGNSILHVSVKNPDRRAFSIVMRFRVARREYVRRAFQRKENDDGPPPPPAPRWLAPDRLVPLDDRIRELAEEITRDTRGELEKARAIYDYVVATMKYDKSGTGWGNGDIYWACDFKRGNCTDFHALFTGLCRAVGIPAKFAIGFPLPPDRAAGTVDGYHCWAEFYLTGFGWMPVDTSEASKYPEKREYFFGAHDAHRVQFTVGRDLVLQPRQAGPPLNYFIYPYAEVDGRPLASVTRAFSFRDVRGDDPMAARQRR